MASKRQKRKKDKLNVTEKVAIPIVVFACICVQENYVLAFMNKEQINGDVTIALINTVISSFALLCFKSLFEKMSANKNQIDYMTGLPHEKSSEKEDDYTL